MTQLSTYIRELSTKVTVINKFSSFEFKKHEILSLNLNLN